MRAAEAKLQTKQKAVNETSEHLKALEQKKSNVGLAIENINNALDYVFFSHGRLSIELKNNKYYLKSNGKDVKPKNVSLGERNIIALCYFFTQILSNQDIGKLYQDEELVVIDDPISSFDFENKVGISSFLRYQTHKIIKGNSNGDAVVTLPVTKDNEFLLIVQPRPVKEGFLVEFPAGYVEDKENPLISAKRELIEETGYYSDNIKYLDSFYQDQGCSEAYNYAYLALDCEKVKEQKLDKDEFVRYFLCNYEEVLELVKMGYIKDIQSKYALELSKQYIKR